MENPFKFGSVVEKHNFTNRRLEIKEILQEIESKQNLVLISQRRIGKTSLIKTVLNKIDKKTTVAVYTAS